MHITRRLLALARDSRLALAATILTGFLAGLLTIGQASVLSQVVARVFLGGQTLPDVTGLLRLILIIVFLRAVLAWGSEISANAVAVRVKSDLRQRLFDKILRLGPAYTRGERTGELVNAAVEGVEALGTCFEYTLTLDSPECDVSAEQLLGKRYRVDIALGARGQRSLEGIVSELAHVGFVADCARYKLVLRPSLWLWWNQWSERWLMDRAGPRSVRNQGKRQDLPQIPAQRTYRLQEFRL